MGKHVLSFQSIYSETCKENESHKDANLWRKKKRKDAVLRDNSFFIAAPAN